MLPPITALTSSTRRAGRAEPRDVRVDQLGEPARQSDGVEQRTVGGRRRPARDREVAADLAHVERVAAGCAVHRVYERAVWFVDTVRAQRGVDVGEVQSRQGDDGRAVGGPQPGKHRRDFGQGRLDRPSRSDHAQAGDDVEQLLQETGARRVGPLDVVDDQQQRATPGEIGDRGRGRCERIAAWPFRRGAAVVVRRKVIDEGVGDPREPFVGAGCEPRPR